MYFMFHKYKLLFINFRISGRILQLESVTQSEAMRRRYRYLSHFSLTTTFQVIKQVLLVLTLVFLQYACCVLSSAFTFSALWDWFDWGPASWCPISLHRWNPEAWEAEEATRQQGIFFFFSILGFKYETIKIRRFQL